MGIHRAHVFAALITPHVSTAHCAPCPQKRMNARDASNLEGVGDLTAAGVRLGNRTFNSLKRDIRKKKEKGMSAGGRVEGATRSTQEGVMVRSPLSVEFDGEYHV